MNFYRLKSLKMLVYYALICHFLHLSSNLNFLKRFLTHVRDTIVRISQYLEPQDAFCLGVRFFQDARDINYIILISNK